MTPTPIPVFFVLLPGSLILDWAGPAEALRIANDTPYGLAASLWTTSLSHAHRLSRRIQAGTVWINTHNKLLPEAETGGFGAGKQT